MKLTRLLLPLLLIVALFAAVPSCRTVDAMATPAQVVTTVHLRSEALKAAETALTAGQLADPALVQLLTDDEAAWKYLRDETNGITISADLKAVMQTQEIGVRVARQKIAAGEYAPAEKVELLHTLAAVWASLETYYHPKNP